MKATAHRDEGPKDRPSVSRITVRIDRVRVLGDFEQIVAIELGQLLGTTLQTAVGVTLPLSHTSVIPLTLVSDHIRIQFGLGVDEATREQLCDVLLGGDRTSDATLDALREMANTAGGAICRAALVDGVSFSIGLPSNENLFKAAPGRGREWTITDGKSLFLECMIMMSEDNTRHVCAAELREGMVLTYGIVDTSGATVADQGRMLTRTTIEEIVRALGPTCPVEVNAG